MAELKTVANDGDVAAFLEAIEPEDRREDCRALEVMLRGVTGEPPRMWGASIVGFGSYHYRYASGREGDWFLTGFSPRKQNLTIYVIAGFDQAGDLLPRLGKHTTSVGCLYVKRLSDVDQAVLRELVSRSVTHMRATNS